MNFVAQDAFASSFVTPELLTVGVIWLGLSVMLWIIRD